jgi:nuclear pore complex protein Nup62
MGIGAGLTAAAVAIGTAVGEAGAAIAAISLTTAFEITAAVGAAISVVGVITKDKTLSMVGMAIGLVGGIGGLASSAGVFGAEAAAGAPLFGAAPAASTATEAAAGGAGSAFGGVASDASQAATYGSTAGEFGSGAADVASAGTIGDVAQNMTQAMQEVPGADGLTSLSAIGEKVTTAPTGLEPAAVADTSGTAAAGSADLPLPPDVPPGTLDANGIAAVTGKPAAAWQYSGQATPGVNAAEGTSTISGGGAFGDILKFVNDNKTLASGVLTTGGKLLEGTFSTLTPAQVAALNAQAAANNAAADLTNQQRTNLAMPKAVASSTPVTGTPGPLVPPSGAAGGPGIINQTSRLAPVTGKVA